MLLSAFLSTLVLLTSCLTGVEASRSALRAQRRSATGPARLLSRSRVIASNKHALRQRHHVERGVALAELDSRGLGAVQIDSPALGNVLRVRGQAANSPTSGFSEKKGPQTKSAGKSSKKGSDSSSGSSSSSSDSSDAGSSDSDTSSSDSCDTSSTSSTDASASDDSSSSTKDSTSANSNSKSSASSSKSSTSIKGTKYDGEATYYLQQNNAGACGDVSQDSDKVVALYTDLYANGKNCGRKVSITNTKGTTIVATVKDECPSCTDNSHIDLSTGAFDALGDESAGVLSITWGFLD